MAKRETAPTTANIVPMAISTGRRDIRTSSTLLSQLVTYHKLIFLLKYKILKNNTLQRHF